MYKPTKSAIIFFFSALIILSLISNAVSALAEWHTERKIEEITRKIEENNKENARLEQERNEETLERVNQKLKDDDLPIDELERLQNKRIQLMKANETSKDENKGKGLEGFLQTHCSADMHGMADAITRTADRHRVSPEVIVAIAWADSRCGKAITTAFNIGNVGNTDGGQRRAYTSLEEGIEAIAQTLNNKYLGHKTTIGSLSRGGGGTGAVYATSPVNWDFNTRWALGEMLGYPVTRDYNFRK